MREGQVNHNSAAGNGGGIYVDSGWLGLESTHVDDNSGRQRRWGVFVAGTGTPARQPGGEQQRSRKRWRTGSGTVDRHLPAPATLTDHAGNEQLSRHRRRRLRPAHTMVTLRMTGGQVRGNHATLEGGGILHNSGTSIISGDTAGEQHRPHHKFYLRRWHTSELRSGLSDQCVAGGQPGHVRRWPVGVELLAGEGQRWIGGEQSRHRRRWWAAWSVRATSKWSKRTLRRIRPPGRVAAPLSPTARCC